ncbi:Arm DNA-binding domain-containing protein [Devosia sp.]|uniref:Arm DNA-binding domain-containing protein n=1 Tax=Devosia sp. TaxID=1871048 RepID=UPI003267C520
MPAVTITQQTIVSAKAAARPGVQQSEITDIKSEGLRLRVGARGVRWQLRFKIAGKGYRLDLGGVDDWSITEARDLCLEAQRVIRACIRRPDDAWLHEQRIRLSKIVAPATLQEDTRLSLRWRWENGVSEYLKEVERTLKPRTLIDYRNMLGTPEMQRFAQRPIAAITLKEMTAAVGDVHRRGVERHAEHLASVIRPMWRYMAHLDIQEKSGVTDRKMMAELEAPTRSRSTSRRKKKKYSPPLHEVARMLIIARAGVFHPTISTAIELLLFTAQRVTAVATAWTEDFIGISDYSEGLWSMPPAHRKTAESRGDEADHIVPLPSSIWSAVERMRDLNDDGSTNPHLFRGLRSRRKGDTIGAIAPSNIQHAMMYSPGIRMRPHDVRRAMTTISADLWGWELADVKTILDHNEGRASDDVTVMNYLWQGTHKKWPKMRAWCELLEKAATEELARDPRLGDITWLKRHIVTERDAHKKGVRRPVSLVKSVSVLDDPVPPGPIELAD